MRASTAKCASLVRDASWHVLSARLCAHSLNRSPPAALPCPERKRIMKARRKLQAEIEAQGWVRSLVVGGPPCVPS